MAYTGRGTEERSIEDSAGNQERIFTLEEARALVPSVRALFERFNRARETASGIAAALEALEERRSRENILQVARPLRERREELGEQIETMRAVVRTVQEMGVAIKSLDPALIDFRSPRDGRIVYLCWREGEDDIDYWHDLDTGYAGRRPL